MRQNKMKMNINKNNAEIRIAVVFPLLVLMFWGCSTATTDNHNDYDFFPENLHTFWEYELTYSDTDIKDSAFPYPEHFTTRVIGKSETNGLNYYEIENYFVPGPSFGEVFRIKKENNHVYIIFQDNEHLFYSFENKDASWSLPGYVDATKNKTHDYWGKASSFSDDKITIQWSGSQKIGRSHVWWEEHFQKGVGRTKIISHTQAYGKIIWELTNTNVLE